MLVIPAALSILLSTACNTVTEDLSSPVVTTNRTKPSPYARLKPEVTWPGQQPDGTMLLPNMWSLKPAGKQVLLGDFPVNIAVHPSGKWAAILHSGNGQNEVIVVHLADGVIVSRVPIEESFYGIAFTTNADGLFCSGAGDENVHQFSFKDGYVLDHRTIQLSDPKIRAVPSGIAISHNGKNVYVANVWGQKISFIQTGEQPVVSELALSTNLSRRVAIMRCKLSANSRFQSKATDIPVRIE